MKEKDLYTLHEMHILFNSLNLNYKHYDQINLNDIKKNLIDILKYEIDEDAELMSSYTTLKENYDKILKLIKKKDDYFSQLKFSKKDVTKKEEIIDYCKIVSNPDDYNQYLIVCPHFFNDIIKLNQIDGNYELVLNGEKYFFDMKKSKKNIISIYKNDLSLGAMQLKKNQFIFTDELFDIDLTVTHEDFNDEDDFEDNEYEDDESDDELEDEEEYLLDDELEDESEYYDFDLIHIYDRKTNNNKSLFFTEILDSDPIKLKDHINLYTRFAFDLNIDKNSFNKHLVLAIAYTLLNRISAINSNIKYRKTKRDNTFKNMMLIGMISNMRNNY